MSTKKYGLFIDDILVEGPKNLPNIYVTPQGDTITGFNKYEQNHPDLLLSYNWYEVDESCIEVDHNPDFETVVFSSWYLENNILKQDHTVVLLSFENALRIAFSKLDYNRYKYEVGGFKYDYNGVDVIIATDRESSQSKLITGELKAKDGSRLNTDVWKFKKFDESGFLVVELSNEDLLNITSYVYRKIQDSYNLTSQISWQMLDAGDTSTLKQLIEDGTIDLNPWEVSQEPSPQLS